MLNPGYLLDGKYKIVSVIGQGGTSTVYLAVHQRLGQKWAVKEINREYCENYGMISRQLIVEADILKRLDHPGLPKIIDIIEEKDTILLVMEFIEGLTLKEIVKVKGKIAEEKLLDWAEQLCRVLIYLHTRKPPIIYRDLKPDNIMLKRDGSLILIDFGTAREYYAEKNIRDTTYLGTRGYAAPEQYGGMGQTDERTDIYCLGITLYSLLTGFNPEKPPYKIYAPEHWDKKVSLEVKEIILKCIEDAPQNRYQNCRRLLEDILQVRKKKKNEEKKDKNRLKKFFLLIILMQISGLVSICCQGVSWNYRKGAVEYYLEAAEKSTNKRNTEQNYRQALLLMPEEYRIYESMQGKYIQTNNFKTEDASVLLGLLMTVYEGKAAIDILRDKETEKYAELCYSIGLGYFYDMGGIIGKGAAEVWFRDVEGIKERKTNVDIKKRAVLYAEIANYYNTFLINGTDKSGERVQKDFEEFYRTLHKLNNFYVTGKSSDSNISAAYLISKEVTVEIINYAAEFLESQKVSIEMLQSELERIKIRNDILSNTKPDQTAEITQLLEDAQKRLEMLGNSE